MVLLFEYPKYFAIKASAKISALLIADNIMAASTFTSPLGRGLDILTSFLRMRELMESWASIAIKGISLSASYGIIASDVGKPIFSKAWANSVGEVVDINNVTENATINKRRTISIVLMSP